MKFKRVFLIVLDSVGIGYSPDAESFGDLGANTLKRISNSSFFNIPNLIKLGISGIDGVDYLEKCDTPIASVARLEEKSKGKDTTVGHWELMGLESEYPMPTYPDGFPEEIIKEFCEACGFERVLCNKPYSGTKVIEEYGKEHIETGLPIVYTSADSVFQIAAHEDVIAPERLYGICKKAREILKAPHGVGRVIARPFITGENGFVRTANRRDFSLLPPKETALDRIKSEGKEVISVGKISDIFGGRGITSSTPTHSNAEGIEVMLSGMDKDFNGLCFVNLVDFDSQYGHRQNIDGYASALSEFDTAIPKMLKKMKKDDLLIITADHGCDPGDESTDHTREYVPLIFYSPSLSAKNHGTKTGFGTVARLVTDALGVSFTSDNGVSLDVN